MSKLQILEVKVTYTPTGTGYNYPWGKPDKNKKGKIIPLQLMGGMNWDTYVDRIGGGWMWTISDLADHHPESPRGTRYGVIFVEKKFADFVLPRWPNAIKRIPAADFETWYATHIGQHQPDIYENLDALQVEAAILSIERAKAGNGKLPQAALDRSAKALDPDNSDYPGRSRNPNKTWAGNGRASWLDLE